MNQKPSSPSLKRPPEAAASGQPSQPKRSKQSGLDPDSTSLDDVMQIDRLRLQRARKRLSPDQYQQRLMESAKLRSDREAATPRIEFPSDLPISEHRQQLIEMIQQRQVIVVCGETGSGKSTQLPKLCLEAGLGRKAMIGHTQPRRLAARSIATRLAEELGTTVGDQVGYQVRFGDQTSDATLIKLMTDGILLAETQSDRFLDGYDAIIIDEAHERSLNIDFLLGFLRQLQAKRSDLKIIITSATIDAQRFAEHFGDEEGPAPIVQVEGRGYPVEIRYLPWESVEDRADEDRSNRYDLSRHVIAGIEQTTRQGDGDVLVFLPTERDIREVSHRAAGHYKRLGLLGRVDLLPLYARLPQSEQQKIFHPDGKKRRIIFATNVAESSLTVPGIRYVVDTGTARISRYSPRSKLQRLPIEPISRASADQRAGRCGRIGPGICIRLYAEDDFDSRDAFTTPEIRRTNLASVILQTKTLRLGRLEEFPLLDPPRPEAVREGVQTLIELGALDEQQELTDIGRQLGRLPVDPRVGRIILAGQEYGVLAEVLPIAAALEIQDPRDRPPDRQQAADEAHAAFADPSSDFLSYLKLWRFYQQTREQQSRRRLTRVLRQHFLSPTRMREWADVHRQLREMSATSLAAKGKKLRIGQVRYAEDQSRIIDTERADAIHQSLLTGLLFGVAMATEKNEYTGTRGLKLFLWPGSGVFDSKPKWVVAAELVETSRQFARTVAKIDPAWIERIAAHLLKRSHHDPHWSRRANGAFCYQNATLFGLPIITRRRVPLPPIDPITARDLLIQEGLVEEQLRTTARFVRYNQQLVASIADLAARTRQRDLIIDRYPIENFYRAHLPEDVTDRGRIEKYDRRVVVPEWAEKMPTAEAVANWLNDPKSKDDGKSPYMHLSDLLESAVEPVGGEDFPDQIEVGQTRLPLEYHFEPGSQQDGIRVKVHQAALTQVSQERLDWLVPGMLHSKLVAMIKSLPKRIRRNLVPAADVADKIVEELQGDYGNVPFMDAVCQSMSRHAEMPIAASDFQSEKIDPHFRFLVTVVDDEGQPLAESREMETLRQQFSQTQETSDVQPDETTTEESWSRQRVKSFDIPELPREVIRQRGGVQVAQYPGLIDHGDSVSTTLFADLPSAEESLRVGMTRLFVIAERKELRSQVRWLPAYEEAKIKLAGILSAADAEEALMGLLARIAMVEGEPPIRSQAEFDKRRADKGTRIAKATQDVARWLSDLSEHYFELRSQRESLKAGGPLDSVLADITGQLDWLFFDRFLHLVPWQWLQHYPRYVRAIVYRIDKAKGALQRDQELTETVHNLQRRWLETIPEAQREPKQQVDREIRWMLEELRVSLFAQPLGTAVKVSPQRCEKLIK